MPLAARQPNTMRASSQAKITPTACGMCIDGSCLSSAAVMITGHSSVMATVRHGTYQRAIGPRCAANAITTGSASSDQRTEALAWSAGSALYSANT